MTPTGLILRYLGDAVDAFHQIEDFHAAGGRFPDDVERYLQSVEKGVRNVRELITPATTVAIAALEKIAAIDLTAADAQKAIDTAAAALQKIREIL